VIAEGVAVCFDLNIAIPCTANLLPASNYKWAFEDKMIEVFFCLILTHNTKCIWLNIEMSSL
jgi:hypothetical protein